MTVCLLIGCTSLCIATPAHAEANRAENPAPAQVSARATDSKHVHSVYIQAENCGKGLTMAFENADIRVGQPGDEVDVILEFSLHLHSGWFTNWSLLDDLLQGLLTRASYEVRLLGKGNQVLLSLHGEERALTGRELCQDIGDKLVDRLTQNRAD